MKPNCLKCIHFFVTWDKSHPRACKVFGFQGKDLPSETVFKTTGTHCPYFQEKTKKKPKSLEEGK